MAAPLPTFIEFIEDVGIACCIRIVDIVWFCNWGSPSHCKIHLSNGEDIIIKINYQDLKTLLQV